VSGERQARAPEPRAGELVCPACGRRQPPSDRFCAHCGMPLVHSPGGEQPASARQRRARKIKPQYTQGPAVVVTRARNQIEAEFIAGLLLEEGIPCVLRAAIGGYAPVVGPRDVLVPESGAQAAREALAWQPPAEAGAREND
jgi:Putative prokaryotic signal transducing protein/zinc-ribbon domain